MADAGGKPALLAESPSAREAAEQLRASQDVRGRSEQQRPSRGLLLLELWTAMMITAYLATALTTIGRFDSPYHLLLPLGIMTVLSTGARERFAVRRRRGVRGAVGQWLAVLVFVLLGILRIRDVLYPWWIDALVLAAVFAGAAAGPVRQWLLPASPERSTGPAPLGTPARLNTVLVAAVLGFLMSTAAWQYGWLIAVAFPLLVVIELVRLNGRWGLRRTGYEWAPVHWTVFGAGLLLLFALILLGLHGGGLTPVLCLAVGSAFTVVMASSALLPRR